MRGKKKQKQKNRAIFGAGFRCTDIIEMPLRSRDVTRFNSADLPDSAESSLQVPQKPVTRGGVPTADSLRSWSGSVANCTVCHKL